MKIKKTVTEAKRRANKANSQQSPGPNDTTRTKYNAVKHGFLAQGVIFRDADTKREFDTLLAEEIDYHEPEGPDEARAVERVALAIWIEREFNCWQSREMAKREDAAVAIRKAVTEREDASQVPLLQAIDQGFQPQELIVRIGARNREAEEVLTGDQTDKIGQFFVEAKMTAAWILYLATEPPTTAIIVTPSAF